MSENKRKFARKPSDWFEPNFDIFNIPKKDTNSEKKSTNIQSSGKKVKLDQVQASTKNSALDSIQEINWTKKLKPKTIEELAVNKKKVEEVQEWIKNSLKPQKFGAPMLLINGPPGSGKTVTVQLICKSLGVDIFEWVTPSDVEYSVENDYHHYSIKPRQSELFEEFLFQAKYPSLYSQMSDELKQIVLVEDYPNAFLRDPSELHKILHNYKQQCKVPIIFICTDSREKNVNLMKNVFPQHILDTLHFTNISFNPISVTFMQKAMKWAIGIISANTTSGCKSLTSERIDAIINTSNGDIRNAMINLHFSISKDTMLMTQTLDKSTAGKGKKKKNYKLQNVGADENLSLMHGVGRVLYPKRKDCPKLKWRFVNNPELIVDKFLSMPSVFISFLHENYPTHFTNIDDASEAIDSLSEADCLLRNWKDQDLSDVYALTIAIRGLMVSNPSPVYTWNPVRGPKFINNDNVRSSRTNFLSEEWSSSHSDYVLDLLPYCKLMNKTSVKM